MTPRKELYIKIEEALKSISQLELIDLYRGQFDNGSESFPDAWITCLISTGSISYENMVENRKKGKAIIDIYLYCKNGWKEQQMKASDIDNSTTEIDIVDRVENALEFLKGDSFTPLHLASETNKNDENNGVMSYKLSFETEVYKLSKSIDKYRYQKINSRKASLQ